MLERCEREGERGREISREVEAALNDQIRSVWPAATELQSLPDPHARPTSPG